jgi:Domain of unknown function (DUF1995)
MKGQILHQTLFSPLLLILLTVENGRRHRHSTVQGWQMPTPLASTSTAFRERSLLFSAPTAVNYPDLSRTLSTPTELPDSLSDAAVRAATAATILIQQLNQDQGDTVHLVGRIDFDTSAGDETYTTAKRTNEFIQYFLTSLVYGVFPQIQQAQMDAATAVLKAQQELAQVMIQKQQSKKSSDDGPSEPQEDNYDIRIEELRAILEGKGAVVPSSSSDDKKPVVRIFFSDEGMAALAQRDWNQRSSILPSPWVSDCLRYNSCSGVAKHDHAQDDIVVFYCPRASDADNVEKIIQTYRDSAEERAAEATSVFKSQFILFVNPQLVDMGVTGFGYAGRLLRERLLDPLQQIYYLRTLPAAMMTDGGDEDSASVSGGGALTRQYPTGYTLWKEDANAVGGYELVQVSNRLLSNPEVQDVMAQVLSDQGSSGGWRRKRRRKSTCCTW